MPREDTQFKPGNPGGPGRPKGSRSKLSEAFLQVLCDDFTQHGIETIERLREEQPAQYTATISKLMPKLLELSGPEGTDIPLKGTLKVVSTSDK